jgi:hypothetical protein
MKPLMFIIIILFSFHLTFSQKSDIVTIENGQFVCDGKPFYPKVCNYGLCLLTQEHNIDNLIVTPYLDYLYEQWYDHFDQEYYREIFIRHFADIKSHGFNCIRTVGGFRLLPSADFKNICYGFVDRHSGQAVIGDGAVAYTWIYHDFEPYTDQNKYKFIELIRYFIKLFEDPRLDGLKLILEVSANDHPEIKYQYRDVFSSLAQNFPNDDRIFAWDMLNEPSRWSICSYCPPEDNRPPLFAATDKKQVHDVVNLWYQAFKQHTSNLVTIGPGECPHDHWDPSVMDVDFIALHGYPSGDKNIDYETRKSLFTNSFYWFYTSVNKPWIIGETGFSANDNYPNSVNIWGSENEQKDFGEFTQKYFKGINIWGYSWFDIKDGILKNPATTYGFGYLRYDESEKAVASVFNTDYPKKITYVNEPTYYYHTYYPNSDYCLTGRVIGSGNNLPIENAYITGYYEVNNLVSEDASQPPMTITKTFGPIFTNYEGKFSIDCPGKITAIYISQAKSCVEAVTITWGSQFKQDCGNIPLHDCYGKIAQLDLNNVPIQDKSSLQAGKINMNNINIPPNLSASFKATKKIYLTNTTISKGSNVTIKTGPIYANCGHTSCDKTIFPEERSSTEQLSVEQHQSVQNFKIYPNPSNGDFTIDFSGTSQREIWISDILGSIVYHSMCDESNLRISIPNISPGVYLVKVLIGKELSYTRILIAD